MPANRRLLAAVLLGLLCWSMALPCAAKIWTDRDGRTMTGTFVRVVGTTAVFRLTTGKVAKVPLSRLGGADRQHIEELLAKKGMRVWTDTKGNQIYAKYLRFSDQEVFVQQEGKTISFPFTDFSVADRVWLRAELESRGKADQLPELAIDEVLSEPRVWTDTEKNELEGRFDRILEDGRVLLAVGQVTRVFDVEKFSAKDHDYLREKLEPVGLAHLVSGKTEPTDSQVAAAPRSRATRPMGSPTLKHRDLPPVPTAPRYQPRPPPIAAAPQPPSFRGGGLSRSRQNRQVFRPSPLTSRISKPKNSAYEAGREAGKKTGVFLGFAAFASLIGYVLTKVLRG